MATTRLVVILAFSLAQLQLGSPELTPGVTSRASREALGGPNRYENGCVTGIQAQRDVEGGAWKSPGDSDSLYLVGFVQFFPDTVATPSRTESMVLESMRTQYVRRGLRVLLIQQDLERNQDENRGKLINAVHDWGLEGVTVLTDAKAQLHAHCQIDHIPTVLLLDRKAEVVRRWDGFARAADLATTINQYLNAVPSR